MSKPTRTDVRAVDPVLTNMLEGYTQDAERFAAVRAFPGLPVDSSSGTYYVYDQKYWMADDMKERAWGSDFAEGGYGMSTDTYATVQWATSQSIPDEVEADNQSPLSVYDGAIERFSQILMIRHERLFAAVAMTTSVWGTDATGGTTSDKWSDYANSDPVGDVRTGKRTISQSIGRKPNKMVMGEIVYDKLVNHPDLIDRIKYTERATVATMEQALAAVLGIDEVLVSEAIYNTANEGQTGSYSAIIDDDALLMYTTSSPDILRPTAGYCFHWEPGGGLGGVRRYYDNGKDAEVVKMKTQVDFEVVASGAGYFFSDYVD